MNAFEVVGRYVLQGVDRVNGQIASVSASAQRSGEAMKRTGDQIDKFGQGIQKTGGAMTKWVTGPILGVGAAIIGLGAKAAETTRDIRILSELSGQSTTEFQKQAFAAKTVGIDMDKYGDIMKDVNDRVGDFLQTGGGPMADFFENIAPKVGVTADQFKGLSGKDSLQLFVSTMEKAGLNSQEMIFHMEAMAGDAARLIPLFRDNGTELDRLGNKAEEAGLILSKEMLQAAKESQGSLGLMSAAFSNIVTIIGASFLPLVESLAPFVLTVLVPAITILADSIGGLAKIFNMMPDGIKVIVTSFLAIVIAIGPVLMVFGKIISLMGVFIKVGRAVAVVQGLLTIVFSPFIAIILAVVAAVAAIVAVFVYWDEITAFLKKTLAAFVEFMIDSFEGMPGRIWQAIKDLPGQIMGLLYGLGNAMTNWASNTISNVVNRFKNMFREIAGMKTAVTFDAGAATGGGMSSDAQANTSRMANSVGQSGGRTSPSGNSFGQPSGRSGSTTSSASVTNIDMRNSIFRDDKDMTDRLRRKGRGMTGGLA